MKNKSSEFSNLWNISPDIIYLNHGSFGACPKEILKFQKKIRKKLEKEAVSFFMRESAEMLLKSKKILSDFVNANNEDIVFVPNVTHGVNAVLRSLKLKKCQIKFIQK